MRKHDDENSLIINMQIIEFSSSCFRIFIVFSRFSFVISFSPFWEYLKEHDGPNRTEHRSIQQRSLIIPIWWVSLDKSTYR